MEPISMLQKVAHALGPLCDEVVFVGGTIPAILITDPAAPAIRPTKDVDFVIDSRTLRGHAAFEDKLRRQGFQIQAPPACRYGIDDVLVDVMSTSLPAMGFSDRWYADAFVTAQPTTLPDGTIIRVIRAPLFLATKLDAWQDRGNGDYYAQDIEDIIAVLDGRDVILDEIRQSSAEVRAFLAESFGRLLSAQVFLDAVSGHLGSGPVAAARADMVIDIMKKVVDPGKR